MMRPSNQFEPMSIGSSNAQRNTTTMWFPKIALVVSLLLFAVVAIVTHIDTASSNKNTIVHGPHKVKKTDTIEYDDDDDVGVVWLMSFPNSGTSFTSKLVRHVTEQSTGSNYGEEADGDSESIYYHGSGKNAEPPFWIDPHTVPHYTRPTHLVLTKTHCGGRCEMCGPSTYIESPHSFLQACLSGRSATYDSGDVEMGSTLAYPASRVKKAIHLIRNPFDNVVSRFHLEQHEFSKKKGNSYSFTSDRAGFQKFCSLLETKYGSQERHSRWMDPAALALLKGIPCHSDFIRYIQWHNLALVVTQDLQIPTLQLHYERYESPNFDDTVSTLLDFLETPARGEAIHFIMGKSYSDYFTKEERRAIGRAMELLALQVTWDNVKHYFDE